MSCISLSKFFFSEEKQEGVLLCFYCKKPKRQEFLGSTEKKITITITNEPMPSIIGFDSSMILLCVAISILAVGDHGISLLMVEYF
jgi:hypothetical protein